MTDTAVPEPAAGFAARTTAASPVPSPAALAETAKRVRAAHPLVHCVTNTVTQNFVANVLLAAGASPAMADVPGEAGPFARIASGLLINLGTPSADQQRAMREAAEAAADAATPWVLDPVGVGAVFPERTALAADLVALGPSIVRGNASEVLALAGHGDGGRGTDAADSTDAALDAARELAARIHGAVAVSGPVDVITDGEHVVRLANGDALLTRVTGGGCALGGLLAAYAAVVDPLTAAAAGSAAYGVAAEIAAASAVGPGSFAVALLDALADLDTTTIADRLRVA